MTNKFMLRKSFSILLSIMLISAFVLHDFSMRVSSSGVYASSNIIYVPDDYSTVQSAVDHASVGDTIIVRNGTYTENVDVYKPLTIRSENGPANCIVQAANSTDHVFEITANNVTINGFTVKGASNWPAAGIYLHANNSIIANNKAYNNCIGVCVFGFSSNNTLTYNNASNNDLCGIYLNTLSNSVIANNKASNNRFIGIYLGYSINNVMMNNTLSGNKYNFGVVGGELSHYMQNIDTSNKVNGKPVYYLVNEKDARIPSDAGYVEIVNSTNIIVKDLTLTNNAAGVLLAYSKNCRIENVNASKNFCGIILSSSSSNTITNSTSSNNNFGIYLEQYDAVSDHNVISNNTVSNNTEGIRLWCSSNNVIYLNNFINNTNSYYSYCSTNIWNSTSPITYVYHGSIYTNYLGNYWSDYMGNDANGDGIGDTPYSIDSDKDYYPLKARFENYFVLPTVTSFSAAPNPFSPNGDGRKDKIKIAAKFDLIVKWKLQVRTLSGVVLRSWTGTGSSLSVVWDGKAKNGTVVADGVYKLRLSGAALSGTPFKTRTIQLTVDTTPPIVTGVSVKPSSFNPRLGQATRINYTISEACYVTIKIYNSSGILVRTLLNNALQTSGSHSIVWKGRDNTSKIVPPGTYKIKIFVVDKAGNRASSYPIVKTVTVT